MWQEVEPVQACPGNHGNELRWVFMCSIFSTKECLTVMYRVIVLCSVQVVLGGVARSLTRCLGVWRTMTRRHIGKYLFVCCVTLFIHISNPRNELIRKLKLYNATLANSKLPLNYSEVATQLCHFLLS